MFKKKDKSSDNKYLAGDRKIDAVYSNLEWILTALAGTLVFIVFVMQVYRIPTGSMAETLRGSHFRLRCSQCGYQYDYDYHPDFYGFKKESIPKFNLPIAPYPPRCSSCGYYEDIGKQGPDGRLYVLHDNQPKEVKKRAVSRGDQIFVLKCIYQFLEPKRWDVIVFKPPMQPQINYIKRLIALPGETVQIIDGDVFIDGQIERKPAKVQQELWMCLYDNDYQPARPDEPRFNNHTWRQPFENVDNSQWDLGKTAKVEFALNAADGKAHYARYNPMQGNDFRATYAYDATFNYAQMPICSDLKMRFYVYPKAGCLAGVRLDKYGVGYQATADAAAGLLRLEKILPAGGKETLAEAACNILGQGTVLFEFENVDHLLTLRYGSQTVSFDCGRDIPAADEFRKAQPQVQIVGQGSVRLSHIGLFRDIHYISDNIKRATEEAPFVLNADEFFVCGDNSPWSYDCRLWTDPVKSNPGKTYRQGIVPRDYLVGKAFFVHFPGGFPFENPTYRKIPYLDGAPQVDGIKVIYGGQR